MALFSKESLELLRERVDLVEVLSSHISLRPSGSSFKALCPFHEEKTPSFVVQRGSSHYHCFGCGAHGDAIQFLMNFQKMSFMESVEHLAQKFGVSLTLADGKGENATRKSLLKEALEKACLFFNFLLLHTEEGHKALEYLYQRGFPLDFIRHFRLGLASQHQWLFQRFMEKQKVPMALLEEAGLVQTKGERSRDFFSDRILIPIQDPMGAVIGFSARKFKETTFGPKYINSPETPLFKKSRLLFGLNYSRRRIAKERKAIIVEGQLDALRLIYSGFDLTVAGQGTAFGEEHVQELLHLGVNHAFLALDGDNAGQEAALKIGHLFQKEAVEVTVIILPKGMDPDLAIREKGPKEWEQWMEKGEDYLSFLLRRHSEHLDIQSPAGKNELIRIVSQRIREWNHPLMVHESLKKLARLTQTPEAVLGIGKEGIGSSPPIQKSGHIEIANRNGDQWMEMEVLRWLFLVPNRRRLADIAQINLTEGHWLVAPCRRLYERFIRKQQESPDQDLLSFTMDCEDPEEQVILSQILQKKIHEGKGEEFFVVALQKLLDRHWMNQREKIREKIQQGTCSEEEALQLAREFDEIKKKRPEVALS